MKQINVLCNLYLEVDDGMSAEDAVEYLMMHLDVDVAMNIHEYKLEKLD